MAETEELRSQLADLKDAYEKLTKSTKETHSALKLYKDSIHGNVFYLNKLVQSAKLKINATKEELSLSQQILQKNKQLAASVLATEGKKLAETKQQLTQLQQDKAATQQLITAKQLSASNITNSIATLKQEKAAKDRHISSIEEQLEANLEEVLYTRSNISIAQKEQAAAQANIDRLREKEEVQKSQIDSINQQIREITKGKSSDELTKAERNLLRSLNKREAGVFAAFNATADARKAEIVHRDSLASSISLMETDLESLRDSGRSLVNSINSEQDARLDLIDAIRGKESELGIATSEIEGLNETLNQYSNKISEITEIANQHQSAIDSATNAIQESEEETRKLKKKLMEDEVRLARFRVDRTSALMSDIKNISDPITGLVESIRKIQQTFGITASQVLSIGFGDLKNVVDTTISALLPFGKSGPPVSMEQIMGAREAFQEEFGGLLTSDAATELAQQAVNMGVTAKQLAQARRVFMTQTMGNANEAKRVQDRFISEFAKKGLTAKDAMATIAQYSELLARNGTRFATAFTRAAADAKKIGIDLNKISQVGDNIINDFEGFLESQAELGAMGFGFDTSRIAEIAATGDDAALYRELRSQLAGMGKDITRLNRPERLALESAFGLNLSEMQRMASGAGSGEKTIEQINLEGNDLLGSAVNFLTALSAGATLTNVLLSGILLYQRAAALRAGIPMMAGFGKMGGMMGTLGMGALGVGGLALAPFLPPELGAVSGGLGGLAAAVTLLRVLGSIPIPNLLGLGIKALAAGAGAYYGYTSASGKSRGGLIEGPGTDTSDSILTRLSNGEYVMRAAAVRAIGVDTLDKMNKVPGMALGGLIGTVASRSGMLNKYLSPNGLLGSSFSAYKEGGLKGVGMSLFNKGIEKFGSKIPGLSGAMSAISAFKEGGFKGALGSLAKGGIGKAIGGAIGTAIPIPGVGTMLGSVVGSKLGKLAGGLFGKKSPSEMLSSVAQTVVPKIPGMERFTPALEAMGIGGGGGASSTATPPLVAQQGGAAGGRSNEDAIGRAVAAAVAAALNGVQIKMDGSSVGKVLVNATDAAASLGVFRQTSRATI